MSEPHGDVRDEIPVDPLVCVCCGAVQELGLGRWGLDWPDVVEGWSSVGTGYACPRCTDARTTNTTTDH